MCNIYPNIFYPCQKRQLLIPPARLQKRNKGIYWKNVWVVFWESRHQMYRYTSILCTIRIYLDLHVMGLGRKKRMYLLDSQYNISLLSPFDYLPSCTAPASVYRDITPSLGVGGLLCLFFKLPRRQGCCFFLKALQLNTGLRLIFLTKPQFWLWSVKLKFQLF